MSHPKLTDELTVKLPDGMRARLDRAAAADHRRPSQWARLVIAQALEAYELNAPGAPMKRKALA